MSRQDNTRLNLFCIYITVVWMYYKCIVWVLFLLILLIQQKVVGIETLSLSYAGNFKVQESLPPLKKKPYPVIIYNHDPYHDWASRDVSYLHKIFNQWGFATIFPISKHRKLNALHGTLLYVRNSPELDIENTYLIGIGSSGLLSLLVAPHFPKLKHIILIAPHGIDTTGHLSLLNLKKIIPKIKQPITVFFSKKDSLWRLREQKKIVVLLEQYNKSITIIPYNVNHKWFRKNQGHYINKLKTLMVEYAHEN